jgi:hypothetical protein
VAERQEVPEGAPDEEAIGVTEDRSRDLRLAVRCRGCLKTWTKRDGWLRQDCAATVGRPTCRFVPALHKGGLRKGPGKKCRSGVRGGGITSQSGKRGRTMDKAVRGTPKKRMCEENRRTRPVFGNGVRQCFSTFVRPRPGKFFFIGRGPGPNKFTHKYPFNFI